MDKVYACSDLHGMYELWQQVKNFLDEDDELIFLGDAIDRGPYGIQILQEMLRDKRVTFIKGNHEAMMLDVVEPYVEGDSCNNYLWCMLNGGGKTFKGFKYMLDEEQYILVQKMKRFLVKDVTYINKSNQCIHLTHAGMTPGCDQTDEDLIWDRNHIFGIWPKEERYQDRYEIHGHTPVDYLVEQLAMADDIRGLPPCDTYYEKPPKPEIVRYAEGHKIDIDLGSFYSGRTALLDLDTLEPIYFDIK